MLSEAHVTSLTTVLLQLESCDGMRSSLDQNALAAAGREGHVHVVQYLVEQVGSIA
jgi:hypothetical protein